MYDIESITSFQEFYQLRKEWNDLCDVSTAKTPYQRWEWNYHWVRKKNKKN